MNEFHIEKDFDDLPPNEYEEVLQRIKHKYFTQINIPEVANGFWDYYLK